jgi:hypothetical protein
MTKNEFRRLCKQTEGVSNVSYSGNLKSFFVDCDNATTMARLRIAAIDGDFKIFLRK